MSDEPEFEEIHEGRQVKRDSEGKFSEVVLSSEVAREMGSKSRISKVQAEQTELQRLLLAQAGFERIEDAPATYQVLVKQATGKSGGTQALIRFMQLIGADAAKEKEKGPKHAVEFMGPKLVLVDGGFYRRLAEWELLELRDELGKLREKMGRTTRIIPAD